MSTNDPSPLGLAVLWLAATTALAAPLAPTDAVSVPLGSRSAPALVVIAATVGVGTLAVVLGVSRLGAPIERWSDRVTTAAVVGVLAAFLGASALAPPDPLTQLLVGTPLVGLSLLAAHAAVAFDVDERVRSLT
ncbi:hypothetical protein [Halorubellus sp. PRR65]|uniref:hypothetical protein n=1 Tax=Halorubellus sp. PRR65 TaxID=3098148 RepID=UPI002B26407A|nr:hypothetical protein [Halorubellus sp. PRR65]